MLGDFENGAELIADDISSSILSKKWPMTVRPWLFEYTTGSFVTIFLPFSFLCIRCQGINSCQYFLKISCNTCVYLKYCLVEKYDFLKGGKEGISDCIRLFYIDLVSITVKGNVSSKSVFKESSNIIMNMYQIQGEFKQFK